MYGCCILCICSSVDRHLDCSLPFGYYKDCCYKHCASAWVDTFSLLLGVYLGVELMDRSGHSMLNCLGNYQTNFNTVAPLYILVNSVFLHVFSTLIVIWLFDSSGCEVISHCDLLCISLITKDVKYFFIVTGHSYVIFREMSVHVLCPFFSVGLSLYYWVVRVNILDISLLSGVWFADTLILWFLFTVLIAF